MKNTKFKLTKKTNEYGEFRICALCNFGDVKKGDLGGFVDSESCLSTDPHDTSWIYDNSRVGKNSRVSNDSRVCDNSRVSASIVRNSHVDNSVVEGNCILKGSRVENSRILNSSYVDNSLIKDNCILKGSRVENSHILNSSSVDNSVVSNNSVVINSRILNDIRVENSFMYDSIATISTLSISGQTWIITITDDKMKIGCENHTHEEWRNFTDEEISSMHKDALTWWSEWKGFILPLSEMHIKKVEAAKKDMEAA